MSEKYQLKVATLRAISNRVRELPALEQAQVASGHRDPTTVITGDEIIILQQTEATFQDVAVALAGIQIGNNR